MNERELIDTLTGVFADQPAGASQPFECDAERFTVGDERWAINIDEFSEEEDRFFHSDASVIGANVAVATLTDLYAAGAIPRFFVHSLATNDLAFAKAFAEGMRNVLVEAGCLMLGGDVGSTENWRCTGVALGPIPGRELTRRLPLDAPALLWISGTICDANVAVFQKSETPRFELRKALADVVRENAVAAIDTSGGVLNALWSLHEQNPHHVLEITPMSFPMDRNAIIVTQQHKLPSLAPIVGAAGEYEFLFATPTSISPDLLNQLAEHEATCIGRALPDDAGRLEMRHPAYRVVVDAPPPDPRETDDMRAYVQQVVATARTIADEPA